MFPLSESNLSTFLMVDQWVVGFFKPKNVATNNYRKHLTFSSHRAHIRSHNVRGQLDHPAERNGLPPAPAARVLSRGTQGEASHDRQSLPLQGGGSGGDPARAQAQGGLGSDSVGRPRRRAGGGAKALGRGGVAVVATG